MVKRYKLDAYDNLVCKEDGYLIYYEDYQALEAENKRLRQALERCYKDLISGTFDPETSDIVRKLLEQSDET